MTNDELESLLREGFAAAAPSDFEDLLSRCHAAGWQDTDETPAAPAAPVKKIHKRGIGRILAAAAMFVLLLGGGVYGYHLTGIPTDYIQMDVNPSIELTLNTFGRVISCEPVNTDADPIVGRFDLQGRSLDYAVAKLTGAMMEAGYITDEKNTVLVGAYGNRTALSAELAEQAASAVSDAAREGGVKAAVLSHYFTATDQLSALARALGVSQSKAALISSFNGLLPDYDSDNLARLSVTELGVLADAYDTANNALTISGTPYNAGHLDADQALSAARQALTASGKTANDLLAKLGVDKNGLSYYVTGSNGAQKYNYLVSAVTGRVADSAVTVIGTVTGNAGGTDTPSAPPATAKPAVTARPAVTAKPAATAAPVTTPTPTPTPTKPVVTAPPSSCTDLN